MLGSRKNSKPEKCSKMPQNPTRQVHALLAAIELEDSMAVKDLPANLLNFTRDFDFYQNPNEIINRNACYQKWILRIKATDKPER